MLGHEPPPFFSMKRSFLFSYNQWTSNDSQGSVFLHPTYHVCLESLCGLRLREPTARRVKFGDVREILTFSSNILAYTGRRGLISSRKIERAYLENVVFMGLTWWTAPWFLTLIPAVNNCYWICTSDHPQRSVWYAYEIFNPSCLPFLARKLKISVPAVSKSAIRGENSAKDRKYSLVR